MFFIVETLTLNLWAIIESVNPSSNILRISTTSTSRNLLNLEFLEKQIICICKNEFMIDLMMINNIVALSITNLQNNIHYFSMSFF